MIKGGASLILIGVTWSLLVEPAGRQGECFSSRFDCGTIREDGGCRGGRHWGLKLGRLPVYAAIV